jgi:hypothetical protein
MIDVHVTRAQRAMSIHVKAISKADGNYQKELEPATRFPAADLQRNQPEQKN